ncbi:unnamed protein product [Larinioides sclopetarius]|uniref:Uncharacterized protein n=1 Tax=Larinioides sclopetarius TaxID=280406 RepID=A0AAV1YY37_9ARAC
MPSEASNPDLAFTAHKNQRPRRDYFFLQKIKLHYERIKDCFLGKRIETQKKPKFFNPSWKDKDLNTLKKSKICLLSTSKFWTMECKRLVNEDIWFENFIPSIGEVILSAIFLTLAMREMASEFHVYQRTITNYNNGGNFSCSFWK